MSKQYNSEALAAAHEAALGLTEAGLMSKQTMRAFDEMCLTPVQEVAPEDIRALRPPQPPTVPPEEPQYRGMNGSRHEPADIEA